jgi:hypothetical protein
MGAPSVVIGVGAVAEGLDWIRAGDETTDGTNVVKKAYRSVVMKAGGSSGAADLSYASSELFSSELALKAPIAIGEKIFTWHGWQATNGLMIYAPSITTETFRNWAIVKPILDFGKSTYDAATSK